MNENLSPPAIELLVGDQYHEQWMNEGQPGKWGINEAGELIQKSRVGNRRGGSGTILAAKNPVSMAISELRLVSRPGLQHQSGIVFNLVDKNNFCAFCIDKHNGKTNHYDLLVFLVADGNFDLISKQRYNESLPVNVSFVLKQAGSNLALFFNDTIAYVWSNMFLFGRRVGLYCYKNNNAAFISLKLTPALPAQTKTDTPPEVAKETIQPQNNSATTQPASQTVVVTEQPSVVVKPPTLSPSNGITEFLGIRKPASKTEIEFTEVFTVPLDFFYTALYTSASLDNKDKSESSGSSVVETLDLRIRGWYRKLKRIREDLAFCNLDVIRTRDRAKEAEQQLSDLPVTENDKLLVEKLADRRTEYRIAINKVNGLRDEEGMLLRKIRINGYSVVENSTIKEGIGDLNYDFHIISQSVGPSVYKPLRIPSDLDLSDDIVWEKIENTLFHRLYDSDTITPQGKDAYESERSQLTTFNANAILVKTKKELDDAIASANAMVLIYETARNEAQLEMNDWEADKQTLLVQKELYIKAARALNPSQKANDIPPYVPAKNYFELTCNAADHVVGWLTRQNPGGSWTDPYPAHAEFTKEFIGTPGRVGKRYRLRRFVADAYWSVLTPDLNAYRRWGYIHAGIAIFCPTDQAAFLGFYHRTYTNYSYHNYYY